MTITEQTFSAVKGPGRSMAIGPRARLVGILERDDWSIWNIVTGERIAIFSLPWDIGDHRSEHIAASIHRDCFVMARGQKIRICDLHTRTMSETETGFCIAGLALSSAGFLIAALSKSGMLHLFREKNEKLELFGTLQIPYGFTSRQANPFSFSPDSRYLAVPSVGSEPQFDIYDIDRSGKAIHRLKHPGLFVVHLAFSRDASKLISIEVVDRPFTCLTWDLSSEKLENELQVDSPEDGFHDQAFSPFGEYVASISDTDQRIQVQHIPSGKKTMLGANLGRQTTFSVDGNYLGAWDFSSQLRVWKLTPST